MDPEKFITIDEEQISLRQALEYLRKSGDLPQLLTRILRQYILERELQERSDLEVDPSRLEQVMVNFRLQNQLTDSEKFNQWLQSQGLTYATFREQMATAVKVEQLKAETIADKVRDYFTQNQAFFEQVVLSRIVVNEADKAAQLKGQVDENPPSFEALAKEHSIVADRVFNGMMGAIGLNQLPPSMREALRQAEPGEIVGPLEHEGRYSILRLERRLPAKLEGQLKQTLEEQFFTQWWQQKLQNKKVKLNL
ncbi:peptidyl-prolyl cis-trans isomerase [Oxynema sp. CENA135]|uniref:peptidylprolyl isomerase n=1 Tax=Oxynema sp. CENA135 TaxID=984206 RepID=UPI00190E0142|nr:peptidylprolyl isomerase [Oxynema sp. CENA135]MBK4728511.1 peptidyl-prolyl cis-trans isomerase [Oxynema sp. CENA135]